MIEEGRFSEFYKKARDTVLKKKKAKEKKPSMDSTTKKLNQWRQDRDEEDRKKYVNSFDFGEEVKPVPLPSAQPKKIYHPETGKEIKPVPLPSAQRKKQYHPETGEEIKPV